jgi:hypothetical protein
MITSNHCNVSANGADRKVMLHRLTDRRCTPQVVQYEQRAVSIKLRTPSAVEHLHLSWHQTAARLCLGPPPDRGAVSEAFAFGTNSNKCITPCPHHVSCETLLC